jgi:hypothetical protein
MGTQDKSITNVVYEPAFNSGSVTDPGYVAVEDETPFQPEYSSIVNLENAEWSDS